MWFNRRKKADLDQSVAAAAKAATGMTVRKHQGDPADLPVLSSHFGGIPYSETHEDWPTREDGRPYDFVCQLNLGDFPQSPKVRFRILTIFLCWSANESASGDDGCLVRTYDCPTEDRLQRLKRPPAVENCDYRVETCTIETFETQTYPWLPNQNAAVNQMASQFRDPLSAYRSSLRRLRFDGYFSRVGGCPTWVHDDTFADSEIQFLAQIDYEPQAANCIGDAAPIYIGFSKTDPAELFTDAFQSH